MQDVSIWSLLARLVLSLGLVIGLMIVAARVLRGRGGGWSPGRRTVAPIEVLGRHSLGRNGSIAIVRAAGKALVVGITEQSISVLTEADPALLELDEEDAAERTRPLAGATRSGSPWTDLMEMLRDRTARRS